MVIKVIVNVVYNCFVLFMFSFSMDVFVCFHLWLWCLCKFGIICCEFVYVFDSIASCVFSEVRVLATCLLMFFKSLVSVVSVFVFWCCECSVGRLLVAVGGDGASMCVGDGQCIYHTNSYLECWKSLYSHGGFVFGLFGVSFVGLVRFIRQFMLTTTLIILVLFFLSFIAWHNVVCDQASTSIKCIRINKESAQN